MCGKIGVCIYSRMTFPDLKVGSKVLINSNFKISNLQSVGMWPKLKGYELLRLCTSGQLYNKNDNPKRFILFSA